MCTRVSHRYELAYHENRLYALVQREKPFDFFGIPVETSRVPYVLRDDDNFVLAYQTEDPDFSICFYPYTQKIGFTEVAK